jgi:hypothetical protein
VLWECRDVDLVMFNHSIYCLFVERHHLTADHCHCSTVLDDGCVYADGGVCGVYLAGARQLCETAREHTFRYCSQVRYVQRTSNSSQESTPSATFIFTQGRMHTPNIRISRQDRALRWFPCLIAISPIKPCIRYYIPLPNITPAAPPCITAANTQHVTYN